MPPLPQSERLARLRLIRSENVGPVTFLRLLAKFATAKAALEALPGLAEKGGRAKPVKICSRADAVREIEAARKINARPILFGDPDYPALLAQIPDPPGVLYVKGNEDLLTRRSVALVGARNASLNGRRLAEQLAADLGRAGFVITSGMARGLDACAHRGGLETGSIAVLAGGIDVVYPKENGALYRELCERGLIASEMPPGTVAQARHFPRRNRIISGLSEGVLVVEATLKSGSLITAGYALDQNREVFALPGSPLDQRAKGGNDLIRQGAVLCESADDIITVLNQAGRAVKSREPGQQFDLFARPAGSRDIKDETRTKTVALLSPEPVPVDVLISETGATPAQMAEILLELELAGRLTRSPGNQVALCP